MNCNCLYFEIILSVKLDHLEFDPFRKRSQNGYIEVATTGEIFGFSRARSCGDLEDMRQLVLHYLNHFHMRECFYCYLQSHFRVISNNKRDFRDIFLDFQ